MKLGEHARRGARKDKAAELIKPRGEETFSVREVFTPTEWEEVEASVFRPYKDFGHIQDRYFLYAVNEDKKHQAENVEELFKTGVDWVNDVLYGFGKTGIGMMNLHQALQCLGILARSFPERRGELPDREAIKNFVHERGKYFFTADAEHAKATGLRILLKNIADYVSIFPEERDWVNQKMTEQKIEQKIRPAIEAEIAKSNWREVLYLSAQARLLFPHLPISHQDSLMDYIKQQKRSHAHMLYTLLPDLLDLRVVLADDAQLGQDGQIQIVDHLPAMGSAQPLPDRLVA